MDATAHPESDGLVLVDFDPEGVELYEDLALSHYSADEVAAALSPAWRAWLKPDPAMTGTSPVEHQRRQAADDLNTEPAEPWWRPWPDLDSLPEPEALIRTEEGQMLIPAAGLTMLYGPMASGKSWAALGIAAATVLLGGRAVLVDGEMGLVPTARRIRPLCGTPPDNLRYAARASTVEIIEWLQDGDGRSLVVLDTIGSLGGHSNDAGEYVEWHAAYIAPFLNADIAVLAVDHDIRSKAGHKDRMQHGSIGSAAKGNLCDLIYHVQGADWSGQKGGTAQMILRKDRHGVHPAPVNNVVAELRIAYDEHGGMDFAFHTAQGTDPTGANAPSPNVHERMSNEIYLLVKTADAAGLSAATIETAKGNAAHLRYVRDDMVKQGVIAKGIDGRYRMS